MVLEPSWGPCFGRGPLKWTEIGPTNDPWMIWDEFETFCNEGFCKLKPKYILKPVAYLIGGLSSKLVSLGSTLNRWSSVNEQRKQNVLDTVNTYIWGKWIKFNNNIPKIHSWRQAKSTSGWFLSPPNEVGLNKCLLTHVQEEEELHPC